MLKQQGILQQGKDVKIIMTKKKGYTRLDIKVMPTDKPKSDEVGNLIYSVKISDLRLN